MRLHTHIPKVPDGSQAPSSHRSFSLFQGGRDRDGRPGEGVFGRFPMVLVGFGTFWSFSYDFGCFPMVFARFRPVRGTRGIRDMSLSGSRVYPGLSRLGYLTVHKFRIVVETRRNLARIVRTRCAPVRGYRAEYFGLSLAQLSAPIRFEIEDFQPDP